MADSSIVTLGTAQSLLVDSSVYDSNYAETTKDQVFLGLTSEDNEDLLPRVTRVVLVGEAGRDDALVKAMQTVKVMEVLKMEVVKQKGEPDGEQTLVIKTLVNMEINAQMKTDSIEVFGQTDSVQFETVFVLVDFDCPDYSDLYKQDKRIIGPPVLLQCAAKEEPLPFSPRPLFTTCMLNLSLCLTGFRDKERLRKLVNVVHHMGGSIRREFGPKVTHLIAHSTHGEKYKLAVVMGRPILTESWISKAWEKRHDISFHAGDPEFLTEFKVPPFQDCVLSFLGFSDEEKANMEERTLKHGGRYLEAGDEKCTHMVVEECSVKELPFIPSTRLFVVKQEWFWGTIQMDARADESMYFYEKSADSPTMKKAVSLLSLNTPNSNRKRRRLRDTLAQLTKDTEVSPFPPPKRHSAERSLSMSLLDISNTPDTCKGLAESSRPSKSSTPAPVKQSARWQVSKELYQTESNYVDILSTILQLFKVPLEKEGQVGGPILAPEEIKTIFGSIPDIFEVHSKIKADLEEMLTDWSEDRSVGDIILKYSKDLVRCYPAFVNFFEAAKETIVRCERQKPRFHAFLKINQSKPECGRQSLVELLIRPVQRLPSLNLLLNDIKKHTSDDNPDKISLAKAIDALKEVLTHINEARRMTEGQKQFFDVVYEVDGVPANLLSSHRSLVCRVETIALGDQLCDRGEQVTLFLFNDCLEIARKRHKVLTTFKSPVGQTRPPAHLKHIMLMPLSQIRRVLDLQDTEDCVNAFALLVRPPTEQENMLVSFQLTAEETVKSTWLRSLSRAVANTICRADAEDIIQCTDPDSLQVTTKDMDSTLSKASRAIKKTSKKVTRAFSFTKTPKRVLQRAFMAGSTPDSPRLTSEHRVGSSATLTIMSRSASTFSLNDSTKSSAVVQRSNSLDHPPVRARIPVCKRAPCSPSPNPVLSPGPSHSPTPPDHAVGHRPRSIYHSSTSSDHPKSILHSPRPSTRAPPAAQLATHSPRPSTRAPPAAQPATFSSHPNHTATRAVVRNLANPRPKSISSANLSLRLPSSTAFLHPNTPPLQSMFLHPPPQSFNSSKGRQSSGISRDPVVSFEPVKKALASPRRETRL